MKFMRCVGTDGMAYYVNCDQIAWCFRPAGAHHTMIRMCGTPDALTVRESPHEIMEHAGMHAGMGERSGTMSMGSGKGRRSETMPMGRSRMGAEQPA
jgi:hypothetical protein